MEKSKNITYMLTKRKAAESDSFPSEKSSESYPECLSTGFSSQSSLLSQTLSDHKQVSFESLDIFPLTKSSSKILQQQISKSSPTDLDKLTIVLQSRISELMVDLYGNYLCQTLFHTCSANQRLYLLRAMRGHITGIAYHSRGTHALQNLIALANLKEEEVIFREEFAGKILEMSKDLNASHVIQRLLNSTGNRIFITGEMLGHVRDLALDKLGVCVLKKCCNDPQIMNEILGDLMLLIQHPYGNYAVQSILEIWKEEIAYDFSSAIQGKVIQLCLQKYASNVVEKALGIENISESIIAELLCEGRIRDLVGNQYGCYVLRTMSMVCSGKSRPAMLLAVKNSLAGMFAPKLKALWQEILENLSR